MSLTCEVSLRGFTRQISQFDREVICRIGESAPVDGETRKLSVRNGDDMSEKEATNTRDAIQRYFPALCNF